MAEPSNTPRQAGFELPRALARRKIADNRRIRSWNKIGHANAVVHKKPRLGLASMVSYLRGLGRISPKKLGNNMISSDVFEHITWPDIQRLPRAGTAHHGRTLFPHRFDAPSLQGGGQRLQRAPKCQAWRMVYQTREARSWARPSGPSKRFDIITVRGLPASPERTELGVTQL